ncbi:hypothetical protein EW093_00820 [Thiospirochaeta perfilievii]|uniref:Uncharacterized protein n=1 Tax=Thiospirochaeta perfilievii TaxID=252967 RepID=A0A5C1Q8U8_9SPIO|nr:STY4851/ECs_5259 family protein [Thiospirochaeta perfilievii]QEN03306.1 hypothetical protein EW093_00820 [Thiospirochaeta perfilievii]
MNILYESPSPKTWLNQFLEKRQLQKPDGKLLFRYQVTKEEYNRIPQILNEHLPSKNEEYFFRSWAALFCLFVSEYYRRDYDKSWSWSTIENVIRCNLKQNDRAKAVEIGLNEYWKRPIRTRGLNGKDRDLLGSLFLEGGLPWTLVQNPHTGFGRIVNRGIKEFHKTLNGNTDITQIIDGYSHYLPNAHQDKDTLNLLAGIVDSLMMIVRSSKLKDHENIIEYLDRYSPDWRSSFPLPIDEENATKLVSEWLLDAKKEHREKLIAEQNLFESSHYQVGKLSLWNIESQIVFPKSYKFDIDFSLLSTLRFEIYLYEGSTPRECLGTTYCEKLELSVQFKFPKNIVTIRRKKIDEELSIKLMTNGVLIKSITIEDSILDTSGPLIFENINNPDDIKIKLLSNASYNSPDDKLVIWQPRGWNVESINAKRVGIGNKFSIWVGIENNAIVKLKDDILNIKLNCNNNPLKLSLAGNCSILDTIPKITYHGLPRLINDQDNVSSYNDLKVYIDGCENKFWDGSISGKFSYVIKDNNGSTLLRKFIGVLPKDFKMKIVPDFRNINAILEVWGINDDELFILGDNISSIEIDSEISKKFILRQLDSERTPLFEIKLKSINCNNPIYIKCSYPVLGASVFDENGVRIKSNNIALNELLGKYLYLNSTTDSIETFDLELELISKKHKFNPRINTSYKVSNETVKVSLFSLKSEFLQILSTTDDQDAYIKLLVHIKSKKILELNIRRYKGYVQLYNDNFEIIDLDNKYSLAKFKPIAIQLSDPKINDNILPEILSEDVATGYYSLRPIMSKEGPWLIIPADSDSPQFRPKLFLPENNYVLSSNAETLERAAKVYHPIDNPYVIDKVINSMANNYNHKSWNYIYYLKENFQYIHLNAFESWLSLSRNIDALVTFFYRIDCNLDFCNKLRDELSVVWESIPLNKWIDGYHNFISWQVRNGDFSEELIKRLGLNKIEVLKKVISGIQFIEDFIIHKINEPLKFSVCKSLEIMYQNLRRDHMEDRWPVGLNDELLFWANKNLDIVEINTSKTHFSNSVTYLPMFMARVTMGDAKLEDLGVTLNKLKFYIYKISDFDNSWYSSVYSMMLSVLVNSKYSINGENSGIL